MIFYKSLDNNNNNKHSNYLHRSFKTDLIKESKVKQEKLIKIQNYLEK